MKNIQTSESRRCHKISRTHRVCTCHCKFYGGNMCCCISTKLFCLNVKHFDRIKIKFQLSIDRIETTQFEHDPVSTWKQISGPFNSFLFILRVSWFHEHEQMSTSLSISSYIFCWLRVWPIYKWTILRYSGFATMQQYFRHKFNIYLRSNSNDTIDTNYSHQNKFSSTFQVYNLHFAYRQFQL